MKHLLAAALLFLAAAAPAFAADSSLSPIEFRDRMATAMAAVTDQPTETMDARTFKGKTANGTEVTVSIDNAYAEYRADPMHLDAILARYARLLGANMDGSKDGADQLVVIVRPSDYLKTSLPPGAPPDWFLQPRPLAGDLSFFLAVNSSETIRLATRDDLARWTLAETAAWTQGLANIRQHVGPITMIRLGGEDGASGVAADSGLAPSILAGSSLCGPGQPVSPKEQVVMLLYARDLFIFAVSGDRTQLRRFWKTAKAEITAGRSLSSTPLTCHDGQWVIAKAP